MTDPQFRVWCFGGEGTAWRRGGRSTGNASFQQRPSAGLGGGLTTYVILIRKKSQRRQHRVFPEHLPLDREWDKHMMSRASQWSIGESYWLNSVTLCDLGATDLPSLAFLFLSCQREICPLKLGLFSSTGSKVKAGCGIRLIVGEREYCHCWKVVVYGLNHYHKC